jgi:hypothetical protein
MSDWRYWSIEGGLIRQGASAATILSRQCQPASATTTASKPTRAHTRTLLVLAGLLLGFQQRQQGRPREGSGKEAPTF